MEIIRPAIAGTLESSDCQVTVEAGNGSIEFELESSVLNQYGNQIKKVTMETLKNLDIDSVKIKIVDKGALDCTIKAVLRVLSIVLCSSLRICPGEVRSDELSK